MTPRRTLALAVALATLAAVLAPPAAAAPGTTPSEACATAQGGEDDAWLVVGYLPATGEVFVGERSLYPGTELSVVVCRRGQKKTFEFRNRDGLTVRSQGEFRVDVTVTDAAAGRTLDVSSPRWVDKPEPAGLAVRVPAGATATSNVTDVGPLPFADPAAAADYRRTEARFRRNLSAVDDGVADLANMTAAAERGTLDMAAANNSTVAAPVLALERAGSLRADLADDLYRAAWRTSNDGRHLAQMEALAGRERTARGDLRQALSEYERALQDRKAAAAWSARTDLGTGLAAGLLVGAVVAAGYFRRKAGGESYDRQFTRDAGLDRGDLLVPVVAAALVLAATLLAAQLLFGVPRLLGAIL